MIATINAIKMVGANPIIVDVDMKSFTLTRKLIEENRTSKTKCVLFVSLNNRQVDLADIKSYCDTTGLLLIEDAAQSHGAVSNHIKAGNLADAAAFSFYPGKNLGALGDAGAITTNDDALAKVISAMRNYGSEQKYHNEYFGVNSRLDEIQAAFLNVKLPHLDSENKIRQSIAKRYLSEIKNEKLILPTWDLSDNHVFHLFVVRTAERDKLQVYLKDNNIETIIHYPIPPHQQKAFADWNSLSYPITEKIHQEVLSLPVSPVMTDDEVDYVIQILNQY
jgi:dTDP-4-amino-4,6-dideoxygalactose transaminase